MADLDNRLERFVGALTGVYEPDELDRLRDEWGGYPSSGGGGDPVAKLDAYRTELENRLDPIPGADLPMPPLT